MSRPLQHQGKHKPHKQGKNANIPLRFVNVTPEEARGDDVGISTTRSASQTLWHLLDLSLKQRASLETLYNGSEKGHVAEAIEDYLFSPANDQEQKEATDMLTTHGLDEVSLEDIGRCWSVKWSGVLEGKGGSAKEGLYTNGT
ncbi:hypothetical protein M422DRAFT_47689 [Sphaerobolus stellatus SS14]|uniref:Uncharacterized protein n=1 Tax=Sphaerobolus stellatus (strain SS14) TaxID=990650 RepID=A0A0C9VY08_SPHS4|nr:hypothetical protein M422DRAFT_47689 [Sphaerobolus stellatus SS14]